VELKDKNILITGGASGIGAALARRFAAEKPSGMALVDLHREAVDAVANEVGALALTADVGHQEQIEAAVLAAERELGPLDLCVSNAGIGTGGGVEVSTEAWQKIWDVNLMAHVHMARAVVPMMVERGSGYLLNTASAAGLLTQIGSAPYAVTKAAAVSFAEWLAITHGQDGLNVSVLCPQAVNTPMIAGMDNGGVAGVDGIMEPETLAEVVVEGLRDERFLILPHPDVEEYVRRKGDDYERWISGMQRLQARFGEAAM